MEHSPIQAEKTQFADLGLSAEVLKAIDDAGYTHPTPIQAQAIPYVLMGRDVLGTAQTGTGKTASFTLPMIDILAAGQPKARMPRSLILEPTRELAAQVGQNFETYGKYNKLSMALLIGGVSFADQDKRLDRGVDVLIATPGRLLDHFERGRVMLNGVKVLVIDEADRMMDMGFMPDVERIVSLIPPLRQTLFFSATMPAEVRRLANKFISNPKEVSVAPPASPAATVTQGIAVVAKPEKRAALRSLIRTEDVKNALIFCNRKRDVDILHRSMKKHGFNAGALHGDMAQQVRTDTLASFKNGEITFLVCSDVAARGLDIQGLSHVFNFDVPTHAEDYVHRIGRTGRAGLSGRAFSLATPEDGKYVAAITALIGKDIPPIEIEGLEAFQLELDARTSRRGRGGKRTRKSEPRSSAKPRSTGRKKAPAAPEAATADAPDAAPADTSEKAARTATRKSSKPRSQTTGETQPRAAGKSKGAKPETKKAATTNGAKKTGAGKRTGRRSGDGKVIGLGDHVPAFLLRPARRK